MVKVIDRSAVAVAVAKCIAYVNCGKDMDAREHFVALAAELRSFVIDREPMPMFVSSFATA
jgi:hypothetical protein